MTLHISYVSDVLCIWAYVAEVRLDEVRKEFGSSVELEYRFIPIFGATRHRIAEGRKDRGGYVGFGEHVRKVAEGFPHVTVNARVWSNRQGLVRGAVARHSLPDILRLLKATGRADAAAKGQAAGNPWQAAADIVLRLSLAGRRAA